MRAIVLLFFTTVLFIACEKQNSEPQLQVDKTLVNSVRMLVDKGTKSTLAFSMLNSQEKFYLVQEQLKFVLQNITLNDNQKDLISRMKMAMPEDLYSNSVSREKFIKELEEMKKEGFKILGKDFMTKYFTKIIDINTIDKTTLTPPTTNAAPGDCECSLSDDWCSEVNNQRYVCMGGSYCKESGWGCGLFFILDCNGKCNRFLA